MSHLCLNIYVFSSHFWATNFFQDLPLAAHQLYQWYLSYDRWATDGNFLISTRILDLIKKSSDNYTEELTEVKVSPVNKP